MLTFLFGMRKEEVIIWSGCRYSVICVCIYLNGIFPCVARAVSRGACCMRSDAYAIGRVLALGVLRKFVYLR